MVEVVPDIVVSLTEMKKGQHIGRYRLREQIGKGGMAEIFRAEEVLPDGSLHTVAIKRMFPRLSADREFVRMFVNEARIASDMDHPNIIGTYDLVNQDSHYYIVMEYIEGLDIEELILQSAPGKMVLPLSVAAYVIHEVAMGLAYAHAGGTRSEEGSVVHRDISPGNILVGRSGQVKITDFGIARARQYASLTRPGFLKGKYEYMSPEYIQGEDFDGRADIFSLGVVLYELLTGKNPFSAVMPDDIWNMIVKQDPPPPSKLVPAVPKTMDVVVARALSKNPKRRYGTGNAMAAVLISFFSKQSTKAPAAKLGRLVSKAMKKDIQDQPSLYDMDAYQASDDTGEDRTQDVRKDMHPDEFLALVEPVAVQQPMFTRGRPRTVTTPEKIKSREKRPRRLPWLSLFVLSLLVAGGLFLWLWPRPVGYLSVKSDLRAEVHVDNRYMGLAPLYKLVLSEGSHLVEVRRPGRNQSKSYRRKIVEGRHVVLNVKWRDISTRKRTKGRKRRQR